MLATEFAPSMAFFNRPPAIGRVFYVHNWTGLDTNNGIDPGTPFKTIAHALTQCDDDRNDYIIVLQHYQEDNIAIDIVRVHIIGVTADPAFPFVALQSDGNDLPIFILSSDSNHVEIAGFLFGGGAGHAAIENVAGTVQQLNIHNCVFGHSFSGNTPQDGILIAQGATCPRIENCTFIGTGYDAGGLITRDGIRFAGAQPTMLNGIIRNNIFLGCPGVGINIDTPFNGGIIKDNVFAVPDTAIGQAIDIAAGAGAGTLVDGNHAMSGGDAVMTNAPFQDLSSGIGVGNHWGQNFRGAAAAPTLPA